MKIDLSKVYTKAIKRLKIPKLGDPIIYAIFGLICILAVLCIYGRTILKNHQQNPEVLVQVDFQESDDMRMERIINEWKERLDNSRARKRGKYPVYQDVYSKSIHAKNLKELLEESARAYQVELPLVIALMKIESGFNPRAISRAGASGLMQLMPGTARLMGLVVNNEIDERYNPAKNIKAGVRYLRIMLDTFDNPVEAIAAYNIGPRAISVGVPSNKETLQHVYKVIRLKYEYEQNFSLMNRDIALMLRNCGNMGLAMNDKKSSQLD